MLVYFIEEFMVIGLKVSFLIFLYDCGSIIGFLSGLDTSLLPIRLENLTGNIDQIIYQYRSLANEYYTDAVKHLRLALHSMHPVYAALLPLIQVRSTI